MKGPVNYICDPCATAAGGVWPPVHVATCHIGDCDACRQRQPLVSVDDYNWPKGKPKGWRGGGRD